MATVTCVTCGIIVNYVKILFHRCFFFFNNVLAMIRAGKVLKPRQKGDTPSPRTVELSLRLCGSSSGGGLYRICILVFIYYLNLLLSPSVLPTHTHCLHLWPFKHPGFPHLFLSLSLPVCVSAGFLSSTFNKVAAFNKFTRSAFSFQVCRM